MSTIVIEIDDRARLLTAVLAASDWPAFEQRGQPHAVHPHAKQTRQFLQKFRHHAAVTGVNQTLHNGVQISELFTTAVRCHWPTLEPAEPLPHLLKIERWARSLADFNHLTGLDETFWPRHETTWQAAASALDNIFSDNKMARFLTRLSPRPRPAQLTIMPNLIFPALSPVLATHETGLLLLLPPPKAVGESPPWPYEEDPVWVVAAACAPLADHLLAPELATADDLQRALFQHATITLCLESCFDLFEGQAYLLRARKEHRLPQLPQVTERLRDQLENEALSFSDLFD